MHTAVEKGKSTHGIGLLSHAVVGYPSVSINVETIAAFAEAGVNLMELQFPFSDPVADGPVLTHANQVALASGTSVNDVLDLAAQVTQKHPGVAFIAMTYMNIVFRRGIERFISNIRAAGISGIIVPDLPLENAHEFRKICEREQVGTAFLVTPTTTEQRAREICTASSGFVYCVGRSGVSGAATVFSTKMLAFFSRVREQSDVPVGVGFGIRTRDDVAGLEGIADIAIVCTEAIKRVEQQGVSATAAYLSSLRRVGRRDAADHAPG